MKRNIMTDSYTLSNDCSIRPAPRRAPKGWTAPKGWAAWLLPALAAPVLMTPATSRAEPTLGRDRFFQFRNLSGLSGSVYGVDNQGYSSLSGPTALSTPIAHTLGRNQFRLSLGNAANDGGSFSDLSSRDNANGTYLLSYGATLGRFNAMATAMSVTFEGELVYNLQGQYIPRPGARLTGSVGVQDLAGSGGSSGEGQPGDSRSSRSFFGVVTYQATTGERPVYVSAGAGTRRFRKGFVSASYQVARPVRVWTEYDGFGINAGLLFSVKNARRQRGPEFNVTIGVLRGKLPVVGISAGF